MLLKLCDFLKTIKIFIVFCVIPFFVKAQQTPQFSQFIQNPFVINPAITGVEEYSEITVSHRNQWSGFSGAPKTSSLTINTPISNLKESSLLHREASKKQGVGLFLYTDQSGPISLNLFSASYAYHLKVSSRWFVSLGTFVGASQFKFDNSDVVLVQNQNDLLTQNISSINFDMSVGIYAYSKDVFAGISANQILNSEIDDSSEIDRSARFATNYNLLIGSRINIKNNYQLVPFMLAKATINAPVQFEVGAKAVYDSKFWGGFSYRNEDAVVGFLGFKILKGFTLNYSYDASTTAFNNQQNGSHEIILGYRFSLQKKSCACPLYSL